MCSEIRPSLAVRMVRSMRKRTGAEAPRLTCAGFSGVAWRGRVRQAEDVEPILELGVGVERIELGVAEEELHTAGVLFVGFLQPFERMRSVAESGVHFCDADGI